ncbi:S-adenosyl-L-methionine-dependent methyltransferase [Sporodiniella umbellata]|nr:S-adenosyl-L-methionine-dependent methyltransferase [Sporodiniella umbellata]
MGNRLSKDPEKEKYALSQIDSSSSLSTYSTNQPKMHYEDIMPQNDTEFDRVSQFHYILKHLYQSNFRAPVETILTGAGSQVLDIACGPHASWLSDMAFDFPQCEFYGIDMTAPDFSDSVDAIHRPKNIHIDTDDLLKPLPYAEDRFDFVHQRMGYLIYPQEKIEAMLLDFWRITKPGGWIELIEPDVQAKRAGPLFTLLNQAHNKLVYSHRGKHLQGKYLVDHMKQLGLEQVSSDYGSIPCCWGGYLGKMVYENCLMYFENLGPSLHPFLLLSEEYNHQQYIDFVDKAFSECAVHQTFYNIRWAIGRKPMP